MRLSPLAAAAFSSLLLSGVPAPATLELPGKPDVEAALRQGRDRLSNYFWRLRTQVMIDGDLRIEKLEDASLAPNGSLLPSKTIRFERKPAVVRFPENDPRSRLERPPTAEEEDRLSALGMDLLQLYASLTPERLGSWARTAEMKLPDPDRPGRFRLVGRGLGRPLDEVTLYLDVGTLAATEVEVKTTVQAAVKDIAFLRIQFEPLPEPSPAAVGLRIPKRIFLNMTVGRRRVTFDMETADWRSLP